ncbi:MAG: ferritin-like domain-containing protein [Parvularculaceae bacterium]|nr:ferritin-like domain-containing protein [Parvularculaceae bacterium]
MDWRAAAFRVLQTGAPADKCAAASAAPDVLGADPIKVDRAAAPPPPRPERPSAPELCTPTKVPKRRFGSPEGRAAVLHALAHIEFNAIDLAFDMAARFAPEIDALGLGTGDFVRDWFAIGAEEAGHFAMISRRLAELGSSYGDFAAHDGLWDAAKETSDSALARLAIAPMVLEARGLDVTPDIARRFRRAGDERSALIIDQILADEVGHVAAGVRWFGRICAARDLEPAATFRNIVKERFRGGLKPPFNREARERAGFSASFYGDWNAPCDASDASC